MIKQEHEMAENKDDTLDWIKKAGEEDAVTESEDISGNIVLEGRLGIAEAEEMYDVLNHVLHAHVDISIQTEGLSRVDAAGVQLLYGFVREAKKNESALTWLSVSDELRTSAECLGLHENMGFDA